MVAAIPAQHDSGWWRWRRGAALSTVSAVGAPDAGAKFGPRPTVVTVSVRGVATVIGALRHVAPSLGSPRPGYRYTAYSLLNQGGGRRRRRHPAMETLVPSVEVPPAPSAGAQGRGTSSALVALAVQPHGMQLTTPQPHLLLAAALADDTLAMYEIYEQRWCGRIARARPRRPPC